MNLPGRRMAAEVAKIPAVVDQQLPDSRRFGGIQLGGAAPMRKRRTQGRSAPTPKLSRAVGDVQHVAKDQNNECGEDGSS